MLALWFAAFAGPTAWTLHNLLSAAFVSAACVWSPGSAVLHALTAATLALTIVGGAIGANLAVSTTQDGARFVSGTSVMLNLLFALVILAEGLPNFLLDPCSS